MMQRARGSAERAVQTTTVTLVLTDIEGSTRLWETQAEEMHDALARHDQIVSTCVERAGGTVIQTKAEGDSTFSVFGSPHAAVDAALAMQRSFAVESWSTNAPLRVRIAIHTGDVEMRHGEYFGVEISRCARLRASAHGGQTLLSGSTARAVRSALPDGASLNDLGQHRLKDLDRAERVYQLCHSELENEFPPLGTLSALRHNLPAQLSPFIAREADVRSVHGLLAGERLVTLTGTGGCGKTRLALQVAGELVDVYADGVWLVELGSLSDASLVTKAVAVALGVREQVGRTLERSLLDDLASRRLLVVLDNCEHLVKACGHLARTLLLGCPELRILATSRQPLGVAGEAVWRVPSLDVPPRGAPSAAAAIRHHAAVALFLERAGRAHPGFTLTDANAADVAEVCRRLDGIPLAIELAAARVNVLTPGQISERLDDRFRLLTSTATSSVRHSTLRTAIDWSYDILSEGERAVFDRLSLFPGGCTIDAVEEVCSDDVESEAVLDHVAGLVDKSLVHGDVHEGTARYHLLETMREYAGAKLEASGRRAAAMRRLLGWCVAFAERAAAELTGPDQVLWYDRIDTEHANIRLALAWGNDDAQERAAVTRLTSALWRYWLERGHVTEGREWLDRALASPSGVPPGERAKALRAAGALAMWQSDLTAARRYHDDSLTIARAIGDELGAAASLSHLGIVAWRSDDTKNAKRLLQESLAIRREHGDRAGESMSLGNLGLVAQTERDYEAARVLLHASLTIDRELGDKLGIAGSLSYLGELAREAGDLDRAEALHRDGLARQRELRQREVLPMALEGMAGLAIARGNPTRAARLFGASESLRRTIGLPIPPSAAAGYRRDFEAARDAVSAEAFERLRREGREMTLDAAISYALAGNGEDEEAIDGPL